MPTTVYAIISLDPNTPSNVVVHSATFDSHKAIDMLREVTQDFSLRSLHYFIQEITVD